MPSFKKSLTAVAVIGSLLAAGAVEAQMPTLHFVDTATWNAGTFGAGLNTQKFPFLRTIAELAASDADGYTLVGGYSIHNVFDFLVAATYTSASDVAAIKAWLAAQPDQNATGLAVTTLVLPSLNVGSVSTADWTNTGANLQPYSVTSACNTTAVQEAYLMFSSLPSSGSLDCATVLVPAMKRVYGAPAGTNCLAYAAFLLAPFVTMCADPSVVNDLATSVCTDGATGAAAFCDYGASMVASGQLGYGPVYSADADGAGVTYPTAAPATTPAPTTPAPLGGTNAPGGAAGGIAPPTTLSVVAAVAVALASAVLVA